ncbi:hypothetical protein HELRODRAFT_165465 [Helobdella robusta]|uniref:Endonuclease/exonuclease/phosphatase domain-containing protein n=1 Tax=Helobdella robusta TaxID=6412 RepID=T1EWU6_HELRO|nr:hypothetical protein HELRODRAFT_165465 [Helobdella robusta]ESN91431.1 hypothetical protein HELRODRAFT_165465 [Helobdella robusta]
MHKIYIKIMQLPTTFWNNGLLVVEPIGVVVRIAPLLLVNKPLQQPLPIMTLPFWVFAWGVVLAGRPAPTCCKWTHLNNCATNLGSYYLCNNCPHPTTISSSPVRGAQPNRPIIRNKTSATPNINPISHSDSKLNILQFNCNGLKNKSAEIAHHLSIHNISIAALPETKLSTRSAVPVFKNYAIYRKDRKSGRGGGLMMLIHHKIPYTIKQLPDTVTMESQGITIMADDTEINIVNVYIPPQSACPPHFCASIADLLEFPNIILLGDLNAHDGLWYSGNSDARGETLAAEIDDSDCCTLNLDCPTRLPSNCQPTSPDFSIASISLTNCLNCNNYNNVITNNIDDVNNNHTNSDNLNNNINNINNTNNNINNINNNNNSANTVDTNARTLSANTSCNWNIINSENPNNNINNTNNNIYNNNSINNNNNNNANYVDTKSTTHSANITCKWNIITRSKKNHSDDNNNNCINNNNNKYCKNNINNM